MAKDTRRKWKHQRIICVAKAKRDAANAAVLAFTPSWGPGFFNVPYYNKSNNQIQEYAADVVLTDAMLVQLSTIPNSILKPQDIEIPTTKVKGKSRLKKIADKRNVNLKTQK